MSVVSKKDIEILTNQLIEEKREILEAIKRNHVEIDPSLLRSNFLSQFNSKFEKINVPIEREKEDESPISLTDAEEIFQRFEALDKKMFELKERPTVNASISANSKGDIAQMNRVGSINDLNRTMMRTSSLLNLTSKGFLEPPAPHPRPISHHQPNTITKQPKIPTNCTQMGKALNVAEQTTIESVPTLSAEQLEQFNSIIKDVNHRLSNINYDSVAYEEILSNFQKKYMTSFERLNKFFDEVRKLDSNEPTENCVNDILSNLDADLIHSMEKLQEALEQVKFLAENKNMYAGLQDTNLPEFPLSDDVAQILDDYYK